MSSVSKDLVEGEKTLPSKISSFFFVRKVNVKVLAGHDDFQSWISGCPFAFLFFLLGWLSLFCIFPSPPAEAGWGWASDTQDEEGYELPPVSVIGERPKSERESQNRSKFMTIIDTSESSSRMTSPSEVVTTAVGVRVNQWGGLGSFSTVSIRGSNPSQVQIYLDGIPVNSTVTGVANLEDFPLDNIGYIEIYRGFTPADFGVAGIGGVVNLVTREELPTRFMVSFSYGSFETYRFSVFGMGPAGPTRHLLFVGGLRTQGDFLYLNDHGTPLNSRDDFEERRINNDVTSLDFMWRVSGNRGPWELTALTSEHEKDQGLPGLMTAQAERTRLTTRRASLYFSARNRSLLGGRLDLTLAGDGLWENQVYDDPEGELGTLGPRKTENQFANQGARVKLIWEAVPDRLLVMGYLEYRLESYLPIEHVPEKHKGSPQRRTLLATVFQTEATDESGRWSLQLTLRQEQYYNHLIGDPNFAWSSAAGDNTDTQNLFSPSIGIRFRASDNLVFKANAGRFYRAPTFYELFGDQGVALGNTSLKPEQGVNFDLGFVYQGQGNEVLSLPYLEYAYYQSRTTDLILFFQNSQRTVRAMNLSGAWIGGHELAFGFTLYDAWRVSGNYTFQSAVDQGEVTYWRGNALPFRPMHEAYLRVEYLGEERWRAWAEMSYVSGNYWDRANLYEVPERRIYNLGFSALVWQRERESVRVTVEGKNLADERVADVAGYPLPGRSFYLTVQARW